MEDLDIRDVSIIDALPNYQWSGHILTVGGGKGRLEKYLGLELQYKVIGTDIKAYPEWIVRQPCLSFCKADIFDLNAFRAMDGADVVICSQVLEHLEDWRAALKNLLELTAVRLIITVPYGRSYDDPDHKNYWYWSTDIESKAIPIGETRFAVENCFQYRCFPYSTAISKIRTKPADVETKLNQAAFLIVVDKRQRYGPIK